MKTLIKALAKPFLSPSISPDARAEMKLDQNGPLASDPGPKLAIAACTEWLCRAQDQSTSNDGGVARDYSLQKGWATSYPETTGYIVPTMLDLAKHYQRQDLEARARLMLDWFVKIQFADGGFQGGKIDSLPKVPVTFNTGQILIGLAAGVKNFGTPYRDAMIRAATWLRDSLDDDGCWRKYPTPFAAPGEKAYETHVSWGLFEAARQAPDQGFGEAGLRQVDWALTKQAKNGWWGSCCLSMPESPLTHTLGYVLRGVLEGYLWSEKPYLLERSILTGKALMAAQEPSGRMPGRLDSQFKPTVNWACLTGIVQIAHCWLLLYKLTGEKTYIEAAKRGNAYVRRTIHVTGNPDIIGGVKGSFPIDGDYGQWEFLNWAAKFCIDSNLLEMEIEEK